MSAGYQTGHSTYKLLRSERRARLVWVADGGGVHQGERERETSGRKELSKDKRYFEKGEEEV